MSKIIPVLCCLLTILIFTGCEKSVIYNPSETLSGIPVIDLIIDEDEYYHLLQNKASRAEVPAKIIYNQEVLTGQVRSSGGGSRMHPRWSYRVELNPGMQIADLQVFSLSSQSLDPTMIRTTIVTRLYQLRGIPVYRTRHVFLKINNRDKGLYLLSERINEEFYISRNIPTYEIYKAGLDSDFSFESPQHPRYSYEKKLPDDNNYDHLYAFIHAVDTCAIETIGRSLSEYMNVDNYLIYHAMSSITNNNDAFKNNYYLHRVTAIAPYEFYPWDFDRAFDPGVNVGVAGDNSLFRKLRQNEIIRAKYEAELNLILDNYFREDIIFPIIDSTSAHIADAYDLDPFLGAGGYNLEFQVTELKRFIADRILYFRENLDQF